MMWGKLLGYRDFAKIRDIGQEITRQFGRQNGSALAIEGQILFFSTKKQKTWLLVTADALFCVLDDISADTFEIRWRIDKNELTLQNGNFHLDLEIEPSYREHSGLIHFGNLHRNWLYSKELYPTPQQLRDDVNTLLLHFKQEQTAMA